MSQELLFTIARAPIQQPLLEVQKQSDAAIFHNQEGARGEKNSKLSQLERLQNRAMRIILHADRKTYSKDAY